MSSFLIPRMISPIDATNVCTADTVSFEVMCSIWPYLHTAKTGVSPVAPGYPLICQIAAAHWQTGHKSTSPDTICVTVSILLSFFCHSKVTNTQSVHSSQGLLLFNSLPFPKKHKFCNQRISILRFSAYGNFIYSQDLIP